MDQSHWLARMEAAVEAALGAAATDVCLAHFHEAGLCSVRAYACDPAASPPLIA